MSGEQWGMARTPHFDRRRLIAGSVALAGTTLLPAAALAVDTDTSDLRDMTASLGPIPALERAERLEQLADWGVSVIRLVISWEAYEPTLGTYDDAYLAAMVRIAEAAWERGIYTIVDVHQDGYSRYQLGGCGDGFPEWAIPTAIAHRTPDNSARSCAGGSRPSSMATISR